MTPVRHALYTNQRAALDALLAADPPLDVLDLAATGQADELRAQPRRRAGPGQRARRRRLHRAAPRRASSAAPAAVGVLLAAGRRPQPAADNPLKVRAAALRGCGARPRGGPRCCWTAGADPNARQQRRLHRAARRRAARRRRRCPRSCSTHGADRTARRRRPRPGRPGRRPQARAPTPWKWTLPFERARACARSTKSSRLIAARNSRATSLQPRRLRAQVEQALLGVEPELDRGRHLVGGHRRDLLADPACGRWPARRAPRRRRARRRPPRRPASSTRSSRNSTVPAG